MHHLGPHRKNHKKRNLNKVERADYYLYKFFAHVLFTAIYYNFSGCAASLIRCKTSL